MGHFLVRKQNGLKNSLHTHSHCLCFWGHGYNYIMKTGHLPTTSPTMTGACAMAAFRNTYEACQVLRINLGPTFLGVGHDGGSSFKTFARLHDDGDIWPGTVSRLQLQHVATIGSWDMWYNSILFLTLKTSWKHRSLSKWTKFGPVLSGLALNNNCNVFLVWHWQKFDKRQAFW